MHADPIGSAAAAQRRGGDVGEEAGDLGSGVAADGVADLHQSRLDVGRAQVGKGDAPEIRQRAGIVSGQAESAQIEEILPAHSGRDLVHKIINGDEDADELQGWAGIELFGDFQQSHYTIVRVLIEFRVEDGDIRQKRHPRLEDVQHWLDRLEDRTHLGGDGGETKLVNQVPRFRRALLNSTTG